MRFRFAPRILAVAAMLSAIAVMPHASAQGFLPHAPGQEQDQNQDQDQPVQIDAKSLEVHDKSKTATFTGDVKVVQGDTTMTCNRLVVFYGQEIGIGGGSQVVASTSSTNDAVPDTQNIRRIEAHGDVTILSKDQSATGDLGVYDLASKTITLSGNVVVSQGNNVIHGGVVIVDTVTGNAHVEPAPGASGRVRALIIPNKDNKGGQSNFMTIGPGPGK